MSVVGARAAPRADWLRRSVFSFFADPGYLGPFVGYGLAQNGPGPAGLAALIFSGRDGPLSSFFVSPSVAVGSLAICYRKFPQKKNCYRKKRSAILKTKMKKEVSAENPGNSRPKCPMAADTRCPPMHH